MQRPAPRGQSQKPRSFPDPAVSISVLVVVSPPFFLPTLLFAQKCQRYPDNFNRPFLLQLSTGPRSRTTMGSGASNGAFNARSSSRSAPAPARLRNGFATATAVEPPPSVCRLVAQGTVVPDAAQALYPLAPCVCGVVVVGLLRHSWEVPRSGFSTQIQSVRVSSAVPLGRALSG